MIKSPMTDRALEMLIDKVEKLEPLDINRQKLMLENAIMNNWKSVYPLKNDLSKPTKRKRAGESGFNGESATDWAIIDNELTTKDDDFMSQLKAMYNTEE